MRQIVFFQEEMLKKAVPDTPLLFCRKLSWHVSLYRRIGKKMKSRGLIKAAVSWFY